MEIGSLLLRIIRTIMLEANIRCMQKIKSANFCYKGNRIAKSEAREFTIN